MKHLSQYTEYILEKESKREYNNILNSMDVKNNKGKVDTSKIEDKIKKHLFKLGVENNNIKGKKKKIKVKDLAPGQNEIFLDEIIEHLLKKEDFVKKALKGKIKDDDILMSDDKHIIDGHHRWVSSFILNPDCKLKCTRINLPLKKAIKIFNKLLREINAKNQNQSGNYKYDIFKLRELNREDLKNAINDIFKKNDKNDVKKFLELVKEKSGELHPINYIISNIHKIQDPKHNLSDRKDMPQMSDEEIEEILK